MFFPQNLENEKGNLYNLVFFGNTYKHSINYAYGFSHVGIFPINMHSHDFYEINIITNGLGRHYISNKSIQAQKCDVFFLPPNVKHGYFQIENQYRTNFPNTMFVESLYLARLKLLCPLFQDDLQLLMGKYRYPTLNQ